MLEMNELLITVMMGVIGTLFFFFSLSSFFIHIVQKNKKIYLKDINIFVLRQINNKINTNFLVYDCHMSNAFFNDFTVIYGV